MLAGPEALHGFIVLKNAHYTYISLQAFSGLYQLSRWWLKLSILMQYSTEAHQLGHLQNGSDWTIPPKLNVRWIRKWKLQLLIKCQIRLNYIFKKIKAGKQKRIERCHTSSCVFQQILKGCHSTLVKTVSNEAVKEKRNWKINVLNSTFKVVEICCPIYTWVILSADTSLLLSQQIHLHYFLNPAV